MQIITEHEQQRKLLTADMLMPDCISKKGVILSADYYHYFVNFIDKMYNFKSCRCYTWEQIVIIHDNIIQYVVQISYLDVSLELQKPVTVLENADLNCGYDRRIRALIML